MTASIVLCAGCSGALGGSLEETGEDLQRVRARIKAITQELTQAYNERDGLTRTLARSEQLAANIQREIVDLDGRLGSVRERADATQRTRVRMQVELAEIRDQLVHVVRASYRLARRDAIAMFLSAESPAAIDRMRAYHAMIERAHAHKIRGIATAIAKLETLKIRTAEETAALVALRDERRRRLAELEHQRTIRADAMRTLTERIYHHESDAARLRADERRFAELIDTIRTELTQLPSLIEPSLKSLDDRPFVQLRGKLPWPVQGTLLAHYGTQRGGGLTWRGVLIGAPTGAPVRSIHRGRIAYADWLRGFGLLLIIEHGDGFMSLYGHNETLIKEVGDWVESGETIATVGDSGGNLQPALYFEIRRAGKPINPRRWCTKPTAALVRH